MLVRLLYASRCAEGTCAGVIDAILQQARRHNPELGLTGVLCHGGDVFMQVLEGGRAEVNRMYAQIARDSRHRDVTLLHLEEIAERCYASWTMGQVNLAKVNPSTLLKYSDRPALDPFALSGRTSIALLQELIATASIIGRA